MNLQSLITKKMIQVLTYLLNSKSLRLAYLKASRSTKRMLSRLKTRFSKIQSFSIKMNRTSLFPTHYKFHLGNQSFNQASKFKDSHRISISFYRPQ